jgi:hypothetical protein
MECGNCAGPHTSHPIAPTQPLQIQNMGNVLDHTFNSEAKPKGSAIKCFLKPSDFYSPSTLLQGSIRLSLRWILQPNLLKQLQVARTPGFTRVLTSSTSLVQKPLWTMACHQINVSDRSCSCPESSTPSAACRNILFWSF